ncbi:MAG: TetR/AcrR family transcriptional regulator [Spirochaetia bacterium]|nr:TetR/AcrR family transcriptional regulator [Spirochaetia bacterium]
MPNKTGATTKARLAESAWKLFYEKGYDNTTIEDIVDDSGTSKGSFYHYFKGKDDLLGTLSMLFDAKYEELKNVMDPASDAVEKLIFLNHQLFIMIDNSISLDLLSRLFSSQLTTRGEKSLLDRNRTYFKLLWKIIKDGQEQGQLRTDLSVNEIVDSYAMFERALMYDWCLCNGKYALARYSDQMMPMFLEGFRAHHKNNGKNNQKYKHISYKTTIV